MYIKKYPQKEDIKMFLSKLKFLEDTETLPPIGEEWWNKIEKDYGYELSEISYRSRKISDYVIEEVEQAIKNKVEHFELINDNYKYNTLAKTAKSAIDRWFMQKIYRPARRSIVEQVIDKIPNYNSFIESSFEYEKKAIIVSQKRLDDRMHVYCKINLDMINNIEQILFEGMHEKINKVLAEENPSL